MIVNQGLEKSVMHLATQELTLGKELDKKLQKCNSNAID